MTVSSNIPDCADVGCLGCGGEDRTRCPCGEPSYYVAMFEDGKPKAEILFRCTACAHRTYAKASLFYSRSVLPNFRITGEKLEKVIEFLREGKAIIPERQEAKQMELFN